MSKTPKYKQGQIVEIVWRDSYHSDAGWQSQEEFEDFASSADNFIIHTCGYVVKETKDNIYLVQSFDGQELSRFDASVAISKRAILEIHILK